jgi:NADH:quinone reductase (non-electrogenic)
MAQPHKPRVVIVGGGFGGLDAAKVLKRADIELTIIDRLNHHCFQPLLYQVATAALSPADIAWPIRAIVSTQANTRVVMGTVVAIDRAARTVQTRDGHSYPYDFLIIATGATHSYFGNDDWAQFAPGLKRIEDALDIRRRLLLAFERAEIADDPVERHRLLSFVVIGGGPTGVEMAGAIAEIARYALARDFRRIKPRYSDIVLIEAGPRLLPQFPETLSRYAEQHLIGLGVRVITGHAVTRCSSLGVSLDDGQEVPAGTLIWAAGVTASPAAAWLEADHDRAGRVRVGADLTLPGDPRIFVVGDTALFIQDGHPLPGLAPTAKQMGRYAAAAIRARLSGETPPPFRYRHYGDLATIGRNAAVVALHGFKLKGFFAWIFWCVAHIFYLIGTRNRVVVALDWIWDYLTFQRGARLINQDRQGQ